MNVNSFDRPTNTRGHIILISSYIFLSGFVFFEPSLAELVVILLIFPFCMLKCSFRLIDLYITSILMILNFIGIYILLKNGWFNTRYFIIDIYLYITFLLFCTLMSPLSIEQYMAYMMYTWTFAVILNLMAFTYAFAQRSTHFAGIQIFQSGLRFTGFFKDPNVFGPFAIVPCLFWISKLLSGKKTLNLSLPVSVILFTGVILTFSRGAMVNLTAGIGILFILNLRYSVFKTLFRTCLLIIPIIIVTALVFKAEPYLSDLFFSRIGLQSYDRSRFSMQAGVTQMITSHPVTGISAGNYTELLPYDTHSLYIRMLGEHGFIGIIFLLILLFSSISVFWKFRHKYPFLLAAYSGLLINSLVIDTWHWRHFWIFLAIALSQKFRDLK